MESNFDLGKGSANLLPPEFYALGIHEKIEPWTPFDSLAFYSMMGLSLTWDWSLDMHREINKLESPELFELADRITPYIFEDLHTKTTIMHDEDVKRAGKWSDKTLT